MDQVSCHKKCNFCSDTTFTCTVYNKGDYYCGLSCLVANEWEVNESELAEGEFWEVKKIKIKTCMGCEKDL
jgi:hypothetical protein